MASHEAGDRVPFSDTQLIKSIADAVIVTDRQARVCLWNPGAEHTFGQPEAAVLGRPLDAVLPDWLVTPAQEAIQQALRTGEPCEQDFPEPAEGSDDGVAALRVKFCPVAEQGVVSGLVILVSDCTQMMELERRFMRTERMASIGKLASGVAHELNNPLDGVLRYCNLALGQLDDNAQAREYLLRVKEGLHRMVRAVKSFLEFSRQTAAPVLREADINRIIEDVLLLIGHRAKVHHIDIQTSLADGLPPVVDSGIQQAISNLIKNAFDAMHDGGTLSVTTRATDGGVEILVQDTGEGIRPEVQTRMFEPFFTTKRIGHGSGLGLTMCKEIVERCRGRIRCESGPETRGTTFTVFLPRADSIAELVNHPHGEPPAPSGTP